MGSEIIFPLAWLASIVAACWLIARSRRTDSRPYALPTLVASLLVTVVWAALNHKPGYFLAYAGTWFAPVVLVFGAQAHAIKWLAGRSAPVAP